MGWEQRNGTAYYYGKVWRNGTCRAVYWGSGPVAEGAAQLDQLYRTRRALVRMDGQDDRAVWADVDGTIGDLARRLHTLVAAELTAAGYHQHKWQWRRARMPKKDLSTPAGDPSLHAICARANASNATADDKAMLQRIYTEVPGTWRAIGDLASIARTRLLDTALTAGYVEREAITRMFSAIRDGLGYQTASQLEQLLIEQIVICQARMQVAEITYTAVVHDKAGCSLTKAEHQERMLVSTQARYLRAIESLARVRRLLKLPGPQFNINLPGGQQVNVSGDIKV